jgi:hypothetical protein
VQRDERLAISFFSLFPTSKSGKYKDCGKIQIVTIIVFPLLAYNNKKKVMENYFIGLYINKEDKTIQLVHSDDNVQILHNQLNCPQIPS